jgi:nitrogen PTS system EIIA component
MKIRNLLQRVHVLLDLPVRDKAELLATLGKFMASVWNLDNPHLIIQKVQERESTVSTGIGFGIAFPHCRLDTVAHTCIVAARTASPVDYGAIDDRPVRLAFMFASPTNAATEHTETLKALSAILSAENVREELIAAPDAQAFVDAIARAEGGE